MSKSLPFEFECPAAFFEKSDAPEGKKRRIAGIISTETRDRQNEVVLQKGLDFNPFLTGGWYNDNHSKDTDGIVGYPDSVKQFKKGSSLPNGEVAQTNLTWAEGYLLEGHDRSDRLWKLGCSLQKSGGDRRLGFSIEGSVEKRTGDDRKTIAKARVRNVALTNCPVNTDTRLEVLAKSIVAVAQTNDDELEQAIKALSVGSGTPGEAPMGPRSGEGAGEILAVEDLERDKKDLKKISSKAAGDKDEKKRKLNKAEAVLWLHERMPHVSAQTLGRIVDTTLLLKRKGML